MSESLTVSLLVNFLAGDRLDGRLGDFLELSDGPDSLEGSDGSGGSDGSDTVYFTFARSTAMISIS